MEQKISNLIDFAQNVYRKENVKELYQKYQRDIQSVTPKDIFLIVNEQLKMGLTPEVMLTFIDKLINVFYKSLSEYPWDRPKQGSFLDIMMQENKGMLQHLGSVKTVIKDQDYQKEREFLVKSLTELLEYNKHFLKLENLLFPYMEKKMERFSGLRIMWALHDEIRDRLKNLISLLTTEEIDEGMINIEIGFLFFNLHGVVQKQELILFPASTEVLIEAEFEEMLLESFDYGFPFIEEPQKPETNTSEADVEGIVYSRTGVSSGQPILPMETGALSLEQVEFMINTLPVDITFVDDQDQVAFFSNSKERIFPRSKAVIGRDVRNCHPPASVHIVEKILEEFKNGQKNSESFWIQMKGMFILIQYFAVRNDSGKYLGTLEVSQEITSIRKLEGEKRLLDE